MLIARTQLRHGGCLPACCTLCLHGIGMSLLPTSAAVQVVGPHSAEALEMGTLTSCTAPMKAPFGHCAAARTLQKFACSQIHQPLHLRTSLGPD